LEFDSGSYLVWSNLTFLTFSQTTSELEIPSKSWRQGCSHGLWLGGSLFHGQRRWSSVSYPGFCISN